MIDLLVISHACFTAINRNVYNLFLKDGWKVEIVVPTQLQFPSGLKIAEKAREEDAPIHFLNLKGTNPRLYNFEGLQKLFIEKKPKIILLDNDPVSRLAISTANWCTKNNSKLFCISCENLSLDIPSSIARRGWKDFPIALVKRAMLYLSKKKLSGVFTLNNDGKQIFTNEGFKNVVKIPLGFDPQYFYPNEQSGQAIKKQFALNAPVIGYFGRITKEKGVHILIQALTKIKELNWILLMDEFDEYATGYNKKIHALLNDNQITERVVFIKPSHEEIASYMNAADLIVVPSITTAYWKEQYGRVAAEAMACGKKLIASNSGALPDLVNAFGTLFPEGDSHALSNLLKENILTPVNNVTSKEIAQYAFEELSIYRQKNIMKTVFESNL